MPGSGLIIDQTIDSGRVSGAENESTESRAVTTLCTTILALAQISPPKIHTSFNLQRKKGQAVSRTASWLHKHTGRAMLLQQLTRSCGTGLCLWQNSLAGSWSAMSRLFSSHESPGELSGGILLTEEQLGMQVGRTCCTLLLEGEIMRIQCESCFGCVQCHFSV